MIKRAGHIMRLSCDLELCSKRTYSVPGEIVDDAVGVTLLVLCVHG